VGDTGAEKPMRHDLGLSGSGLKPDPDVHLIDLNEFEDRLRDVITSAAEGIGAPHRDSLSEVVADPGFSSAVTRLLKRNPELTADPQAVPQFRGVELDGNPVAFLVRRFRLQIAAGGYYQTDLQRDSARLFHAVRNLLRYKDWQEKLIEAHTQLVNEGFQPVVNGKAIREITDFGDLLPARKSLEPRRPDCRAEEAARPEPAPAK
jgi:hypothetical protein